MRGSALVVCLLIAAALFLPAFAADAPIAPPNAELEKLVPGDQYTIAVKRGRNSREVSGTLIEANARWILLRRRTEMMSPTKLKTVIPGVTRNGLAPSIVHDEVWIPRDAATVVERVIKRRRETIAPPEQDGPWTATYQQRGEVAEAKGLLVAVDSETATIDLEESRMSISTGDVIEVRRQTITFIKKP